MPRVRRPSSLSEGYKTKKPEAQIKLETMRELKKWPGLGVYIRNNTIKGKLANGAYIQNGEVGSADIIGCHFTGRFVGLEAKMEGKDQSDEQKAWQKKIEGSGGAYILFTSPSEAVQKLLNIK